MSKGLKKWKLFKSKKRPKLDLPLWFLNILERRGINSAVIAEEYLDPGYENLVSSDNFLGLKEGVKKLAQAVKSNDKIVVYGDYDVDGITATALIVDLLNKIGVQNFETYIPHRENEGYGLNKKAVKTFLNSGVKLIITVDCGITSKDIIDSQDELDFIIIDHHQIDSDRISKKAINIHPSLTKDNKEYFLSGCGIAFYFARAVQAEFDEIFPPGQEKWLLDLVALATICDIVPLVGENRILATWGLQVLSKTKRPGLVALAKVSSVNLAEIGSYEAGFLLGPRINAAGRLEHAKLSLELLTTTNEVRAREIATELNRLNMERQQMCEKIVSEVKVELKKSGQGKNKIFLLSNKNWPRGVVGIVASRISDEHHKPVIVFEDDGEMHYGSARSVEGFNIVKALNSCGDYLERFGGHAKAAGLTVSNEKFVLFSDKLISIADQKIKESDLIKRVEVDTKIDLEDISDDALELIAKMEPTGYGNPQPVFLIEDVEVESVNRVGKGREHLKFKLKQTAVGDLLPLEISAIAFGEKRNLKEGRRYDLIGGLRYNTWNNRKTIEFRVIDFKENKTRP